MKPRRIAAAVGLFAALGAVPAADAKPVPADSPIGPSTSTFPYVIPDAQGVGIRSLLTAGDLVPNLFSTGPYKEVGIPDGLGAMKAGGNKVTLLENHELNDQEGITRRHGQPHSFVSKMVINRNTGETSRPGTSSTRACSTTTTGRGSTWPRPPRRSPITSCGSARAR